MLCLRVHVFYTAFNSREIMDSLIMAKYCKCILTSFRASYTRTNSNVEGALILDDLK